MQEKILELIKSFEATKMETMEVKTKKTRLVLTKNEDLKMDKDASVSQVLDETEEDSTVITSPLVGIIHFSQQNSQTKTGDHKKVGDFLFSIEVMKVINSINAEIEGEIIALLVDEGELVEFGQPIIKISPQKPK